MGSVDQADQLLKPYSSGRKSLAWFKKLGFHFIDRMLSNSFIVYRNMHPRAYKKKRFLDFIKEVCTGLFMRFSPAAAEMLNNYEQTRKRNPKEGRRQPPAAAADAAAAAADVDPQPAPEEQPRVHQRTRKPPTAKKDKPTVRCRECSLTRQTRKETRYICAVCPESPGLCSSECFEAFHLRTQRGADLNVRRAQVPVPAPPALQNVSPIALRTRGGLRRRRGTPSPARTRGGLRRLRGSPSPGTSRTRVSKRKRSQRPPPPPSSDSSSPHVQDSSPAQTQPDSPLPELAPVPQVFPGTSTSIDPQPGPSGLTPLQPAAIPVAVVAPVLKKARKEKPKGPLPARRNPDGSYVGLTDSEIESQNEGGNSRRLDFEEF